MVSKLPMGGFKSLPMKLRLACANAGSNLVDLSSPRHQAVIARRFADDGVSFGPGLRIHEQTCRFALRESLRAHDSAGFRGDDRFVHRPSLSHSRRALLGSRLDLATHCSAGYTV